MVENLLRLSNADYHADTTRLSKSGLDALSRSPAHFWHQYLKPDRGARQPTAAMLFGSLVHTLILEPDTFHADYVVATQKYDKRTTTGKAAAAEFEAQAGSRQVVDADSYAVALRMCEAVVRHPAAAELLLAHPGIAEATLHFTHPHTNTPCKVRPDFLHTAPGGYVVDIKTTDDASPEAFARSVANYRYHVQNAFYVDALALAGARPAGFMFVAVEKSPPYNVAVYTLPPDAISFGRGLYYADLERYAHGQETGTWGGYSPGVVELEMPRWALRSE